jgi:autotransporter-associated beta strand protein
MKPLRSNPFFSNRSALAAVSVACALAPALLSAAIIDKDDDTDDLNLTSSWTGAVVPGANDVARWSGLAGANSVLLGGNLAFQGITIATTGGAVSIGGANTLTLGTSGIDMGAANQNLSITSNLALATGGQTWNVATGRTLTISGGTFSRSTGATLLIDRSTNTGTVTASPTLTNGVLPWAIVRSSGTAANNTAAGFNFATVSGGNIVAYTAATAVTTSYPANSAATNYDWSSAGTQAQIGSSRAANTIRYTGTGVTQQTNSTQTQTFNALMNAGSGTVNLGGGTQTMNIQSATGELVLAAMSAGIVINGNVVNNGATAGAVTIMGGSGQTVTLAGANNFTGNLNINSGTFVASRSNNTNNPTTSSVGNPQAARSINVNSGGTLRITGADFMGSATTTPVATLVINQGGTVTNGGNNFNSFGPVIMNGGQLTTSGGAAAAYQSYNLMGSVTVGGSSASSISVSGAGNAFNGVHLNTNTLFNVADATGDSAADLTVSTPLLNRNGSLGGAGGFTKDGAGTMTLTGANVYTGATTISGGTLQIGNGTTDGSIASSSGITNNGALVYNLVGSQSYGNAITGSGTLTKAGAGTLTLSGTNSYGGATTIDGGTLALTGSLTSNIGVNSGGTITGTGSTTGSLTLNAGSTFSGNLSGILTANGVSFTGATTLIFNGATTNGSTYDLFNYGAGGVSGLGFLSSTFRATLFDDTANTKVTATVSTGNRTWNTTSGTWQSGSASTIWQEGDQRYFDGDTVTFGDPASASVVSLVGTLLPAGTVTVNNTNGYTFSGGGSIGGGASLSKSGSGDLTISNTNAYSGGTTLNGGSLTANAASALGTGPVTVNAGTLHANHASGLGSGVLTMAGGAIDNSSGGVVSLSTNNAQNWNGDFTFVGSNDLNMGNGNVTLNGGDRTVNIAAGTLTVGRLANTGGGLVKNGAGTLQLNPTAASSLNGTLTVNAGTLGIGSQDLTVNGLAGSGTIQNGSATTRWLFVNTTGGSSTFGGTIEDGGTGRLGLNVFGGNSLTANGALNLTDRITVNGATTQLIVNGASSGAAGTVFLEAGGNLVLNNASALAANTLINLNGAQTASVTYGSDGGDNVYLLSGSSNSTLNLVLDRATAGTDVTHTMSTPSVGGGLGGGTFMLNLNKGSNVSGTATASFNQFNLGGGSGGSTTINPAAGVTVAIGSVTKSNNNVSQTLVLDGVGTAHAITGAITNGAATGGNSIALTKSGASTWTLAGNSTYTGATTVSAGTLLVNGSLGNTAVSVTGGTLGGSGSIAGSVAVSGTLSPGNSIESLATGALTMSSGSSYVFEVADNSSAGADLTAVNGTLSLTGVTLDIDAASLAALAGGSWILGDKLTLISYLDPGEGITSGFNGYLDDTAYTFGSNQWLFDYNDTLAGNNFAADATANSQNRFVTMTLVPEPSAALLGAGGLLVLLRRRRR